MSKYILSDIFEGDYPISQYYGANPKYYSQFGLKGHEGIDWATPTGVKILAPFDGQILRDNDDFKNNAYGNFVVLWDPKQKCAVWFCHLSENNISINTKVRKGDVLGKTGNSGNSSGPHLHINFVETDDKGNRQNMGNGYQGFLNILDPVLVGWKSGGSQPQPIQVPTGTVPVESAKFEELVNKATQYDKFKEKGFEKVEVVVERIDDCEKRIRNLEEERNKLTEAIKNNEETLVSLNQLINEKNNLIATLNSQISTLESRLLNEQTRANGLEEQAKKVPILITERDELLKEKDIWRDIESNYKRKITQLEKDNELLRNNWFTGLIKIIIEKIFKRG